MSGLGRKTVGMTESVAFNGAWYYARPRRVLVTLAQARVQRTVRSRCGMDPRFREVGEGPPVLRRLLSPAPAAGDVVETGSHRRRKTRCHLLQTLHQALGARTVVAADGVGNLLQHLAETKRATGFGEAADLL